jgi:hypothetical protein
MKEDYHQTQFVTRHEGENSPDHFFIITAHNPFGKVTSDEMNNENNTLLLEAIEASKWNSFPVTGQCENHAEAGYGIKCSRAEAIVLGKQFRQDAIYGICNDQVVLVDCQNIEADEVIGTWSKLQAPTS